MQLATDRCDQLDDPWRDRAMAVRFHEPALAVDAIRAFAQVTPVDGVLAVGDRPAAMAAAVAEALRVPWHSHAAAQASRSKLRTRQRLRDAGLPVPDFAVIASEHDLAGGATAGRWSSSRSPCPAAAA